MWELVEITTRCSVAFCLIHGGEVERTPAGAVPGGEHAAPSAARGEPWRTCGLSSRGPVLAETGTAALACTSGVTGVHPTGKSHRPLRTPRCSQSERSAGARALSVRQMKG